MGKIIVFTNAGQWSNIIVGKEYEVRINKHGESVLGDTGYYTNGDIQPDGSLIALRGTKCYEVPTTPKMEFFYAANIWKKKKNTLLAGAFYFM